MSKLSQLHFQIAEEERKLHTGIAHLKQELLQLEEGLKPRAVVEHFTETRLRTKTPLAGRLLSAFLGSIGADKINTLLTGSMFRQATHFTTRVGLEYVMAKPLAFFGKVASGWLKRRI